MGSLHLVLHKKSFADIVGFYEYRLSKETRGKNIEHFQRKLRFFEAKKEEIQVLGAFQLCDLKDLMDFCNSSYSKHLFKFENHSDLKNKQGNEIINDLRNLVMHGKNPIEKNADTSIYSIESLEKFKKSLDILEMYNFKLEELIFSHPDNVKSIQLENKNKLKIIHEHHPHALKYFIGN